jgi:aminopeptidase N
MSFSQLRISSRLYFSLCIYIIYLFTATVSLAQTSYSREDSLKGGLTSERIWWDLTYYDLYVNVNIKQQSIEGINKIYFTPTTVSQVMQIDLQAPMQIDSIFFEGKLLKHTAEGAAHFVHYEDSMALNINQYITVYFSGTPVVAVNPPWDGGFTWTKDENGNPFIATANQGIGASVWWPCKEHPADEVDSMDMHIEVPKPLINVSNGRLVKVEEKKESRIYHWSVKNPINNYGVNINIGDYVNFSETFDGEKGALDCSYWVLSYNLEKAKRQFTDVPRMLEAFEYWFGPYPFYEDSYKLVEAPYLGMEHQSSITYGNGYSNGYRGSDLSGSGWGMKFDFIIIHESGHEWFANNITNNDAADMWIHESFTHYSENLFLDYHFGTEAANAYIQGVRSSIQNDRPIIGDYGVASEGSSDMYYKGGNMLHTLRQMVDNDEKWREMLRALNKEFYHQTVSSKDIEASLAKAYGKDLTPFFDQYLRTTKIPTLTYRLMNGNFFYKWENTADDFDMPVKIYINGEAEWIQPAATKYKVLKQLPEYAEITIDPNFYIASFNLTD